MNLVNDIVDEVRAFEHDNCVSRYDVTDDELASIISSNLEPIREALHRQQGQCC